MESSVSPNTCKSIIHFTMNGNIDGHGSNTPDVLLCNSELVIISSVNGDSRYTKPISLKSIPLNTWASLLISQTKKNGIYLFSANVNGINMFSDINTMPLSFTNVKVYSGDPWFTYADETNVYIKDLKIVNGVENICLSVCHSNAACVKNTCICNSGYLGDGINNCTSNCSTLCDPNASCVRENCICNSGYFGDGVNNCTPNCSSLCHPNASCVEKTCVCNSGYFGDGILNCTFSALSCWSLCHPDAVYSGKKCDCKNGFYGNGYTNSVKTLLYCKKEIIGLENYTGLYEFPETLVNTDISLNCVYNASILIQRTCLINLLSELSMWQQVDLTVCPAKSEATQQLILDKENITESNVKDTAFRINQIVQGGNLTNIYDSNLISSIFRKIINVNSSTQAVTEDVLTAVDTLLTYTDLITEANKQFDTSSSFISILDDLGKQQNENMTISKKNLALASYFILLNQNPIFICSSLNNNNASVAIMSEDCRGFSQNIKASIILPSNLFSEKRNIKIYSYVFFVKIFFTHNFTSIDSAIISATIDDTIVKNSSYPILIKLLPDTNVIGYRKCSFYKASEKIWSSEGCNSFINSSQEIFCQCNHLTNFALILDVDQSGSNPLTLRIITWIGCIISIAGLFLTVLSFSCFRELRANLAPKILISLCINLMITLVLFLTLVERTKPRLLCQIVASILQFFLLSTFFWMAVEGINLYMMFVKVFRGSFQNRTFMVIACVLAWGIPLIIAITTALVNPDNLGPATDHDPKICVVRGNAFYVGVLLPTCVVILVNVVFIVFVLKGIYVNSNVANKIALKKKFRIALGCSLLLGTTWIFAVLAISNLRNVFQWLFCIFNSLQGFFIFLFYVVHNIEVKSRWRFFFGKNDLSRDLKMSSTYHRMNFQYYCGSKTKAKQITKLV